MTSQGVFTAAATGALTLAAAALGAETGDSLCESFAPHFRLGVAVGSPLLRAIDQPDGDAAALGLVERHFNSATAENAMKWQAVHPRRGLYDFRLADRFVELGERRGFFLVGHTLVWHRQTPAWVFRGPRGQPASKSLLLERLRDHIDTVVGRYRGRVQAWDVVNEALNADGSYRDSPWLRILGEEYVEHAFRFAHEADRDAELYYNDYSLTVASKRDAAAGLVQRLQENGCRVDGIGMQGHWRLDRPSVPQIDAAIAAYARVVDKVMISELDIDVLPRPEAGFDSAAMRQAAGSREFDPYALGLPESKQQELAERYASIFELLVRRREVVDRVTFWGLDDGRSWQNKRPIPGRTAHSLLFDRQLRPKPAFHAVIDVANARR